MKSICCVIIMLGLFGITDAAEIFIIGHNVPADSLSKAQIKNIFLGKIRRWDNGQKIIFAVLAEGEVHRHFIRNYTGKTQRQFKMFWKKLTFIGKGRMPQIFKTEVQMIEFINNTKGALGYVSSNIFINNSKVKNIKIK